MIKFKDSEVIENVPFAEYLKWDGYSNSFLKMERGGVVEPLQQSEKITFGSLVDDILTSPQDADVSDERFPIARKAATKIIEYFNGYDNYHNIVQKQLSIKSTMYDDQSALKMPVRGRIDFFVTTVIDLKVTDEKEEKLEALMKYMKYPEQVYFYTKQMLIEKDFGYILFYLRKEDRIVPKKVTFTPEMEEYFYSKLLKFGK